MKATCPFLVVFALCGLQGTFAQETNWTWQNPLPQGNSLHAVHFVDDQIGWVAGDAGTIFHTEDGGVSWTMQSSSTQRNVLDVHFVDALTGWAVASDNFSALILHTTDGGATWTEQHILSTDVLSALHFVDAMTGWAAGGRTILHTGDGGATWVPQPTGTDPAPMSVTDVYFADAQTGWVVSRFAQIFHTTDGGTTWTHQDSGLGPTILPLNAVYFVDAQTGWIVGNSTILHTTDGGATWIPQDAEGGQFTDVHFVDDQHGWIATNQATSEGTSIRVTTNGGVMWSAEATGAAWDLLGVHFADVDTGWIVGVAGEIRRTDDGGANWTAQTKGSHDTFWDFTFIDASFGVAVGPLNYAYYTEDGGKTWIEQSLEGGTNKTRRKGNERFTSDWRDVDWNGFNIMIAVAGSGLCTRLSSRRGGGKIRSTLDLDVQPIETGTAEDLFAVRFADSLNAWISGSNGTILHTGDGGDTWAPQNSGVSDILFGIDFVNPSTGWVTGESGTILHSTDGGQTWTPQVSGTAERLHTVLFADEQTGWIVGGRGTILHTSNGGATWTEQDSGTRVWTLYDIALVDDDVAWIVGDGGTILRSTDGAQTWSPVHSGTTNALLGIGFVDPDSGWIVGGQGTILRFAGGGIGTAIGGETGDSPAAFVLEQNYPNPFNPSTTIHFSLSRESHVRLQVFDVMGRLVKTLTDGPRAAGRYAEVWDATSVPSGVYAYRMRADRHIEVRKMVLIR